MTGFGGSSEASYVFCVPSHPSRHAFIPGPEAAPTSSPLSKRQLFLDKLIFHNENSRADRMNQLKSVLSS